MMTLRKRTGRKRIKTNSFEVHMTQANTPNGKLLANTVEAEQYTGRNRIYLQDLIKNGTLKNYGSSTRFRYSWREIEAYFGALQ